MKRSPGDPGNTAWVPLLGVIVQMAALALCSWAMSSARTRGRQLAGGTLPAPPVPPAAAPPPPFESAQPTWSPGVPPPPTGTVPPPPAP